jgi:beta-galactosidase
LSTRGVYTFPVSSGKGQSIAPGLGLDNIYRQVSSYDVNYAAYGASPDKEFESQEKWPFVGGEFVWTGWDYLGEPTPFDASRSSYYGIIDLAGFRKDRFYLYQSHWRPDFKMAHILPHWTWPDRKGKITPVHVYSSGDEAELFLNDKSMGRIKKGQYDYRFRWDSVIYEPGELKVITYKNGEKWATDFMRTAGNAARLELTADRNTIDSDGRDLSFITLRVLDSKGTLVPQASNHIVFEVSGPGEIVSTDNGDPTSFVSFHSKERDAFNGLVLVIVRIKPGIQGIIKITAKSNDLTSAQVIIKGK